MNYRVLILEDNLNKLKRINEVLLPFKDSLSIDHFGSIDKGADAIK
jgi:hypothetical protein